MYKNVLVFLLKNLIAAFNYLLRTGKVLFELPEVKF